MRGAIKLPDVQYVRFILEDRRLVVVHIEVVWSGEEGHHGWETGRASFPVHTVSACAISRDLDREGHWHTQHPAPHAHG